MYELIEIVESMMLQKSIQPLHTHGAMASISACGVWEIRAAVQVFRRELYTLYTLRLD